MAIGVLSFFIVSSVMRFVLWRIPELDASDPFTHKIAQFESWTKPIDVLFIGASYVNTGVSPAVFDREMTGRGRSVTSFNLGIGDLGFVEMEEVINTVVDNKKCCKFVIFSPAFSLFNVAASVNNVRGILYMDFDRAISQSIYMLSTPYIARAPISRLGYIRNIIFLTFRHYSNIGLASSLFGKVSFTDLVHNWSNIPILPGDGFSDNGDRMNDPDYQTELSQMQTQRPGYVSQDVDSQGSPPGLPIAPWMLDRVLRLADKIEAKGAVPLLLITPEISYWDWDTDLLVKFTKRCGDSHVLNYGDPAAFPELFAPPVRLDGGHLNGRGAAIWSKLLAQRIADMLDHGGPTTPFCQPPKPGIIVRTENR